MTDLDRRDDSTIAVIVFELRDGVGHEALIEAMNPVCDLVRVQPGFIDEKLLRVGDGSTYIDIVRWRSADEVDKAGELLQASPVFGNLMSMTEPGSARVFHGSTVLEAYARPVSA